MKSMIHSMLALSLLIVMGCTTSFRPWNLSEIEEGMDRSQVVGILGEPDSVEMKDGMELLHYTYEENYNPPLFVDAYGSPDAGRQLESEQLRKGLKEYRYVVKLVDDKVLDYEELVD